MNNNFIEIHEFSTGIKVGRNNDGSWVSLGFTGKFINSTFQEDIPHPVERAIANGEFKIQEGTASDNPAIMGRVVGINDDPWSVVAVVSKGRDESASRSFPTIRYFLSTGEDKIPLILEWLEEFGDLNTSPKVKVFNPDNPPENNLPHKYASIHQLVDLPALPPKLEQLKNENNLPIIVDSKINNLKIIHQLALEKVISERKKDVLLPLAWAFNVQVVEYVNKFTVIHPANESAANILRQMRVSAAMSLPASLFDEQALKAAITNITNNSNIKDEHFVAFAKELLNEKIDEKNWIKILDGQGAKNALSQGIYTPQMVKLIILRAIIIPSTLPQCFEWIQAKDKKSDVRTNAKEFERVISTKINALSPELKVKLLSCIDDGFSAFIAKVAESKISSDTAREFLLDKEGLWGKEAKNFLKKLHNDLEKMPIYAKKNDDLIFELKIPAWSAFRNQIVQFWGKYPQFDEKIYLPLALTFRDIQPESLSMIFYHMSGKKIPHDLIKNSQEFHSSSSRFPLYGIRVERELNFVESLRETLNYCLEWIVYQPQNRNSMKRITAIISIIFAFLMGGAGGYVLHKFMPKGEEVNKTSFLNTGNDDSTLRSSINRNGNADILRDPNQANKEIVAKYIYKLYESESQKQLPDQTKRDEIRQKNLMLLQGEDKNKLEEILKALVREPNGSIKKEIKRHIAKLSSEEIDRLSNSIMLNGNQP
jgi:hypothetical protein